MHELDFEKITPDDCQTLSEALNKEFGKLDGLYNNAGWLGASSPVQQYDSKLWHRVMQINLNAHFMLTQACLPLLNHDTDSSIVFTLDDKSTAYWGAYGVSKAGLTAFMKILADELKEVGKAFKDQVKAIKKKLGNKYPDKNLIFKVGSFIYAISTLAIGSLPSVTAISIEDDCFIYRNDVIEVAKIFTKSGFVITVDA